MASQSRLDSMNLEEEEGEFLKSQFGNGRSTRLGMPCSICNVNKQIKWKSLEEVNKVNWTYIFHGFLTLPMAGSVNLYAGINHEPR
jgi:hypothetical protein